jgi:hypothetical protein
MGAELLEPRQRFGVSRDRKSVLSTVESRCWARVRQLRDWNSRTHRRQWRKSSFSADSPEEAGILKAASRRKFAVLMAGGGCQGLKENVSLNMKPRRTITTPT